MLLHLRTAHQLLFLLRMQVWRDELVIVVTKYALTLLDWHDRWVEGELDSHLVVIWEDHHGILVANDKVDQCSNKFSWLELV